MQSMTVGFMCELHGLTLIDIMNAPGDVVRKEAIHLEVYEKAAITELLAQPGVIAIRPLNLFYNGQNNTILVGIKETPDGMDGTEYTPMLDNEHIVALPINNPNPFMP